MNRTTTSAFSVVFSGQSRSMRSLLRLMAEPDYAFWTEQTYWKVGASIIVYEGISARTTAQTPGDFKNNYPFTCSITKRHTFALNIPEIIIAQSLTHNSYNPSSHQIPARGRYL